MHWLAAGTRKGKVPLLIGPTGSGKSEIAIKAAQEFGGEIISMDSCAVYRGMDIGSAKPSVQERSGIKHHLIDILNPNERYNAGRFFSDVCRLVPEIQGRGAVPIIVGGTMMYANTLLHGMASIPSISAAKRQQALEMVRSDPEQAHYELEKVDPNFAARIYPNDQQRLARAWEVYFETGRPLGEWLLKQNRLPSFTLMLHCLLPVDKQVFTRRLHKRFDLMLEKGFAGEVRQIVTTYGETLQSLKSVGYKQMVPYVLGNTILEEAISEAKLATVRLARYQMSWIRRFSPLVDNTVLF